MVVSASTVINPVHQCRGTDRNRCPERGSRSDIGQPMCPEIHATQRHDDGERCGRHLKVSALWACRY
jgi:hypothetical protein